MKYRIPGAVLCTTIVLGTACQSPVDADDPALEFAFGVHRLQNEAPFVVAETDPLTIRGYLFTPCQPYGATASAAVEGDVVILRVTARRTGGCRQVIAMVGYQAIVDVEGIPVRHLRIVHEWPDTGRPAEAVFEGFVSD